MMIKDRTAEFFSAVSVKSGNYMANEAATDYQRSPLLSPKSQTAQKLRQHSQFTQMSLEVNSGIQNVLGKLEKLTKCKLDFTFAGLIKCKIVAKSKTMFDDRPVEVFELSQIIQMDLAGLNERIAKLQATQKQHQLEVSKSGAEHNQNVVFSLQNQLATISSQFTKVIETRSSNLKAQKDRRERFGASTTGSIPSALKRTNASTSKQASGEIDGQVSIDISFQSMALAEQTVQIIMRP